MTTSAAPRAAPSGPRARARARRAEALALARALPVEERELLEVVEALGAVGSRPDGFRVAGTPEDDEVARSVAGRMRDAGLERVAIERVAVDGWRLGDAVLELPDGRELRGACLGGAPGTPPGGVRAPLVDVGTGGRRRLDRLELSGRIALLDWHSLTLAPADVALELGLRGVLGVVVACFEGGPLYQAPGAVGAFDSHWHAGAPPVLTLAREDAAALRAELRAGALEGTLRVEVATAPGAPGANVVGYLEGREPGEPIVIGAHHDGWFRAAFDNATGVAALLALAAGLGRLGHRPRDTLCFTSRTGEEYGRTGTPFDWCVGAWGQIAETHPAWGAGSPFHLCLEASGHPGLRTIVEAPVELAGWARSACRAADAEGWLTAGWRVGPPVTGTEQWPFLVAGVPGVAAYAWETSFRRHSYHTPLDTPAIVDPAHLARVTRAYALMLAEADADPDALHDHGARARHVARRAEALGAAGEALGAAARGHAGARGRAAFTAVGRGLHAVDAHGAIAYPHAQATADLAGLEAALQALADGDATAAARALEGVGSNRLTRVLSAEAFAIQDARRRPDAPRLGWAGASHLTASPDLWAELATLRGEPGSRAPGPWLEAALHGHHATALREQRRRLAAMTRALAPHPPESP